MDRLRTRVREGAFGTIGRRLRRLAGWAAQSYVVLIAAGLVVGLLVAPVVSGWVIQPVSGTVAVIPVEGAIDGQTAAATLAMLQKARSNPNVDAVVLHVNSPGGAASASETMYLGVKQTADQMPVVTSVDALAASGAYYTAAPSDHIFAKPSSLVGSIGVIFVRPAGLDPIDRLITTGPDKLTGADEREWDYKTESLKRAFVGAVVESRGDRLELSRAEVSTAELFTGGEAVRNGLADEIGGLQDAIARAANMAGLVRYDVKVYRPDGPARFITRSGYLASSAPEKRMISPSYFIDQGGSSIPNYLMLPPQLVRKALRAQTREPREVNATNGTAS